MIYLLFEFIAEIKFNQNNHQFVSIQPLFQFFSFWIASEFFFLLFTSVRILVILLIPFQLKLSSAGVWSNHLE